MPRAAAIVADVRDEQRDRGQRAEDAAARAPSRPPRRTSSGRAGRRASARPPPPARSPRARAPPLATSRRAARGDHRHRDLGGRVRRVPAREGGQRGVDQRVRRTRPVDRRLRRCAPPTYTSPSPITSTTQLEPAGAARSRIDATTTSAQHDRQRAEVRDDLRDVDGHVVARSVARSSSSLSSGVRPGVAGQLDRVERRNEAADARDRQRGRELEPEVAGRDARSRGTAPAARSHAPTGRTTRAIHGPRDRDQRPQERAGARARQPVARSSARGAGTRPRPPTITATVTPKPKVAWPAMCATLVERAPEDVAEHAEGGRPRARCRRCCRGRSAGRRCPTSPR